jgi:hypothetical protein
MPATMPTAKKPLNLGNSGKSQTIYGAGVKKVDFVF